MKRLVLATLGCLMLLHCVLAQEVAVSQAPAVKTFSLNPDNIGTVASSVNMLTGDLNLPLNLLTLPGRNGLDVSVAIGYNSNVSQSVGLWNLESPAGILGLGWNMDLSRIICDNKGTGAREDDEYFLVEGGSTNKLIRTTSGSDTQGAYYVYQTQKFNFWKIKFYYDPVEMFLSGVGANKWEITREDGTRVIYGDKNSGRETIEYAVRWNNWIGSSSATTGQSKLAITWNLSEIVSLWGDKVKFEYEQVKQFVGSSSGQMHTEACYLKEVTDVFGKKIQFIYNERQAQFFAEPHTERPEPDAYQERYERKYLDRIDVRDETGFKFTTLQFLYASINETTNRAKMMLTSIQQFNASMNSMPPVKLSYISTGQYQGMLNKVTYPTGGTATYNYSSNKIYRSARDLEVNAPEGYSEPKLWMGDDYAILCWRQEGSGGTHVSSGQLVQLYVYQWLGEWKQVVKQTIGSVEAEIYNALPLSFEYKNFLVSTGKNFFAVLRNIDGNNYRLLLLRKDPTIRGGWQSSSRDIDVGPSKPTLITGENYVAVGTEERDIFVYTDNGSGWNESVIEQYSWGANFDYTGNNNFLISQREKIDGGANSEVTFSFLTEDKTWVRRYLSSSLASNGIGVNTWYSSNALAFTMCADAKERAYRWSGDYNTFYMDIQDNYGNDLFGTQDHNKKLSMSDNAFIATGEGWLARFDGVEWWTNRLTHEDNAFFEYAFGSDIGITPNRNRGAMGWEGRRKTFDPNTRQWSEYLITSPDAGDNFADIGIDCYYYGNGYFYRQPDGSWSKIHTYPAEEQWASYGGYPRFQLRRPAMTGNERVEYVNFKNGQKLPSIIINGYYVFTHSAIAMLPSYAEGNNMFALIEYPDNVPNDDWQAMPFVDRVRLYKIVNDGITDQQVDIVVSSISLATSDKVEYTAFQYVTSTAAMDPAGTTAYYHEVISVPGVTNAALSTRPFGYTKTFFVNGLSASERFSTNYSTIDYRLFGMPIETQVFDNNNTMVSNSTTTYTVFSKDFFNASGQKVESGSYSLPTKVVQTMDGITTTINYTYDNNTGQLTKSIATGSSTVETQYKYFWEVYDPTMSLNILPAIAQEKTTVNGVVVKSKAIRYKLWTGLFSGGPVWAASDQYGWAGTNSSDFTLWNADQGMTSADWIFLGKVAERSAVSGAALENVNSNRSVSSVLYDASSNQTIAQVNAPLADIAHTSFEKAYTGNFNHNEIPVTGVSKTGTRHVALQGTISKTGLNAGKTYTLSFWAKGTNCVVSISGVGVKDLGTLNDWTLIQYDVSGLSSISVQKVSGTVLIDEVRLHPKGTHMVTTAYHPLYGVQSAMDANHQLMKTEYDEWGRVHYTLDDKGNIMSINTYNFKN